MASVATPYIPREPTVTYVNWGPHFEYLTLFGYDKIILNLEYKYCSNEEHLEDCWNNVKDQSIQRKTHPSCASINGLNNKWEDNRVVFFEKYLRKGTRLAIKMEGEIQRMQMEEYSTSNVSDRPLCNASKNGVSEFVEEWWTSSNNTIWNDSSWMTWELAIYTCNNQCYSRCSNCCYRSVKTQL
jgi:hypothetical protein